MSGQPLPPPPAPGAPNGSTPTGQAPPVTNGMAIASLVTGLVAVVLFWSLVPPIVLGILAVVFGGVAKGRANQGAPNGTMAIVGIVLGIIAIVGAIAMILLWTDVITTTEVTIDQDGVQIDALILRR